MVATKIAKGQVLPTQPRDDNTEALEVQFAKFYCKDGTDERDVIVEYRRYEADPRVEGPSAATAHARHQYLSKLKHNMHLARVFFRGRSHR